MSKVLTNHSINTQLSAIEGLKVTPYQLAFRMYAVNLVDIDVHEYARKLNKQFLQKLWTKMYEFKSALRNVQIKVYCQD